MRAATGAAGATDGGEDVVGGQLVNYVVVSGSLRGRRDTVVAGGVGEDEGEEMIRRANANVIVREGSAEAGETRAGVCASGMV
jgi:hypothetical protein